MTATSPHRIPPSLSDTEVSRRQFLGQSARQAATVAAGVMAMSSTAKAAIASERVRVGIIGVRNRGRMLMTELIRNQLADVRVLCDADETVLASALNSLSGQVDRLPRPVRDFRAVLQDPEIDAVVIAAPDHWHTTMTREAMEAGKDVYVESPAISCLADGAELLATAARTGRIVQCGVQERSGLPYQQAMQFLQGGQLGSVRQAKAWVVHRRKPIPAKVDCPPPTELNYADWQGATAGRPFNPNRCHTNWRWFWDYGGGELSQWGSHLLDVARWGLNVHWPERVTAIGGKYAFDDATETPDTLTVNYAYDGRSIQWEHRLWSGHAPEGRSSAVAFFGTRGVLVIDRGGWKVYDGEPAGGTCSSTALDQMHLENFVQSIRQRTMPHCPLATAMVSTGLCHLGNIAYRLGREIRFNPQQGICVGDAEATAMVHQRQPQLLPRSPLA